jgi:hypothetical protein
MSVINIDLHGIKHENVRCLLIGEIEAHWSDDPSPDFHVVTGHSDQMREIVNEVANEYGLQVEPGLHGAYLYLRF